MTEPSVGDQVGARIQMAARTAVQGLLADTEAATGMVTQTINRAMDVAREQRAFAPLREAAGNSMKIGKMATEAVHHGEHNANSVRSTSQSLPRTICSPTSSASI